MGLFVCVRCPSGGAVLHSANARRAERAAAVLAVCWSVRKGRGRARTTDARAVRAWPGGAACVRAGPCASCSACRRWTRRRSFKTACSWCIASHASCTTVSHGTRGTGACTRPAAGPPCDRPPVCGPHGMSRGAPVQTDADRFAGAYANNTRGRARTRAGVGVRACVARACVARAGGTDRGLCGVCACRPRHAVLQCAPVQKKREVDDHVAASAHRRCRRRNVRRGARGRGRSAAACGARTSSRAFDPVRSHAPVRAWAIAPVGTGTRRR